MENIVAKGEIAQQVQFRLFPQRYQMLFATEVAKFVYIWERSTTSVVSRLYNRSLIHMTSDDIRNRRLLKTQLEKEKLFEISKLYTFLDIFQSTYYNLIPKVYIYLILFSSRVFSRRTTVKYHILLTFKSSAINLHPR